jgi:hypothetical protein
MTALGWWIAAALAALWLADALRHRWVVRRLTDAVQRYLERVG